MPVRRMRAGSIALFIAVLLAATAAPALARFRSSGPGCASDPDTVIENAEAGDVFTPLYEPEFGRNTNGAVIKVNFELEGGWSAPNFDCGGTSSGVFESRDEMLAAGLTYSPNDRSGLRGADTPVLSVDSGVKSLRISTVNLLSVQQVTGSGGGLRVVGAQAAPRLSGATVTIEASAFQPDFFLTDPVGALGDGGGLYLDLDAGSSLTIERSLFKDQSAGGDGGGFVILVRGGSQVTIEQTLVEGNRAAGSCGGGKIVLYSGTVTLRDNQFRANGADGETADLCIVRPQGSPGPAIVYLFGNSFSAGGLQIDAGITVFDERLYLPLVRS